MTPDRREELRRCDDACYRTRTSREMNELKERIKALESLLAVAGQDLQILIGYCRDENWDERFLGGFEVIVNRIDAILPKTEEVKYIPKTKISPEYE